MRQLAVQAANDTLTLNDRVEIQREIDQLKAEINRIANTTEFNTKKLLDGTAAALTSTDKATTQVIVKGPVSTFGNYEINIAATPGKSQILKTDIFKAKGLEIENLEINTGDSGIQNITLNKTSGYVVPVGSYQVSTVASATATVNASYSTTQYRQSGSGALVDTATAVTTAGTIGSGYLLLEVTSISGQQVTFTFREYYVNTTSGTVGSNSGVVTLTADGSTNVSTAINGATTAFKFSNFTLEDVNNFTKGDKILFRINNQVAAGGDSITIQKTDTGVGSGESIRYAFAANLVDNRTQSLWTAYLNTTNGQFYVGQLNFQIGSLGEVTPAATFDVTRSGDLEPADIDATLREVDRFTDANGNFLVEYPQTITIYQGNGKSTTVTFFATDTLRDVRQKLNDAIAYGLGQAQYVGDNANLFVEYVTNPVYGTPEAVAGTFVIRTAVPGAEGKLYFSGDQAFINALSLNVIQEAEDSKFTVTIYNAHTGGNPIAEAEISGNRLVGVLDPNVDVVFDAMSDIKVSFSVSGRAWSFSADSANTRTYVHLADSSLIFHIGANAKQDMNASIGESIPWGSTLIRCSSSTTPPPTMPLCAWTRL